MLVTQSWRQDTDLGRGAKRTRESKDRRGGAEVSRYRGQEAIGDRTPPAGPAGAALSGNAPVSLLNYDKRLREVRETDTLPAIVHFTFSWQQGEPTRRVILMSAALLLACLKTGDVRSPARHPTL